MLGHLHSRAEATDQRVGLIEQAIEATYSRLEARIEKCEAGEANTNVINERFDDMMKNMDARDTESDKKSQVAQSARLSARRKFEQDLAKRLGKLDEAQKAASSAATAAQEPAGRAAAAASQASTTRPASEAEMLIAGFQKDTPREEISGVARKVVGMSAYGPTGLLSVFPPSTWRLPLCLGAGSTHIEAGTEYKANKLVAELRNTNGRRRRCS